MSYTEKKARPILRLNMDRVSAPVIAAKIHLAPEPVKVKRKRKPKPVAEVKPVPVRDYFASVVWKGKRPAVLAGPVLPLAIGLGKELLGLVADGNRKRLRVALGRYTHSAFYITATAAEGAVRHGLDGHPVAPVSAEDRAWAQAKAESAPAWVKARIPQP